MEKYNVRIEISGYIGEVCGGPDDGGRVAEMAMMIRPADTVDAPACMHDYLNYVQVMSTLVDQMADWGTHVDALTTTVENRGARSFTVADMAGILEDTGIMPEVARVVAQYVADTVCTPWVGEVAYALNQHDWVWSDGSKTGSIYRCSNCWAYHDVKNVREIPQTVCRNA